MTVRLSWIALGMILLAATGLMAVASRHDAAVMDELAHIPAGYTYVRYLDYRLNPEHPPLVKALSGLPLLAIQPRFPVETPAWQAVNAQWDLGAQFLYKAGNDPDRILRFARIGPMLLMLLLVVVVYLWSKELFGRWWAFLPTLLTALSPTILAHGHYVTTDVGAALGMVLASWAFTRFLEHPSRGKLAWAGIAFGVAQLLKFSNALLGPYFILLAFFHWYFTPGRPRRKIRTYAKDTFLVFLIGFVFVVYPAYLLFTWHYPLERQTADITSMMRTLEVTVLDDGQTSIFERVLQVDLLFARYAATKPIAHWLLGLLMVAVRGSTTATAYFMGTVSNAGSHMYFPMVYLLKETLPALLFIFFALLAFFRDAVRRTLRFRFPLFAMALFALLYWASSITSPLNIGVRHLIPVMPFMYMLATPFWKKWISSKPFFTAWLRLSLLAALFLWLMIETLGISPRFLSYYNQLAEGTKGGYRYATDSNYDWGQDLKELKAWADDHPEAGRIAIDYFGAGDPKHYLGDRAEYWWSAKGSPADQGIGWFAISIDALQRAIQPAVPGFNRKPEDEYRWLTDARPKAPGIGGVPPPDARAGTSIFLYRL